MGKVVKCVDSPLPGVLMKASLHPQQPGEVLIRYEVEMVSVSLRSGNYWSMGVASSTARSSTATVLLQYGLYDCRVHWLTIDAFIPVIMP